ncbi:NAD(P)-dependent oxidoreductase [Synechococcus sp. CCY 9618]|uniref:NAD-dependent epimerase/dehydratase family protein n=1 Tax=Synechococcus sp. CCY 9618 TaxID=2815602 RepID=UPI0020B41FE5|nr:NAD-dependent epimerase/dehydratase family protein [Synechococcus sp. CCY 9618]
MKNILITGGLGFIGSNLARRLLEEGHRITLVDSLIPQYGGNLENIADIRDRLTVNISDVRDPFATRELLKGVDVIFNLAGQTSHADSMTDPFTDLDINAKAQLSLLEAVRDVNPGAIVVFASTRQIYGRPQYLPVDEAHPIRPVDVNGVNKVAGEQFHLLYHDVYGIRSCALRLTNTYGPGMRIKDARQTFLGVWVRNLLTDQPLLVFGDGKQLRDFNYVDDVVDALIRASVHPDCYGKAFNLGSSEVVSLADLATRMVAIEPEARWQLVPFPPERQRIDIGDYYSDHQLASHLLGWQPVVPLAEGLQRTVSYYRRHLDSYL